MKTLVVKIGTSTLIRDGAVDDDYLAGVARQVEELRRENWRTVIVSSGAIRVGLDTMKRARAARLAEKQAAAAVGQSLLMRSYRRAFGEHERHVAQLLLTRSDLADRRRFLNARHTMTQLLRWDVVPVVNENDTVATDEIRVGDNDTLAALTALVAEADLLLLLSDIDGFYLPGATAPLATVDVITPEIEAAAGGAGSVGGTGGMRTKLDAAQIAMRAGIGMVIADGRSADVILNTARGSGGGTRFAPLSALSGRKSWIAYGSRTQGTLLVHDRARDAIVLNGSSLLPIGILGVEGDFEAGALVALRDSAGEYGRGITALSAVDLKRVAGRHSSEVCALLGKSASSEAVHRDNLTLLPDSRPEKPIPHDLK